MNVLVFSTALAAKANEWNRIATVGEWKGYKAGEAKLAAEDLESCVAFHAQVNRPGNSQVVIDYEHSTLRMLAGQLDPKLADAAGWVQELQLRQGDDGPELWQRQSWTQAAAAKIEAGEKGYLSPVILFGTKHPVTGEPVRAMLHSVGLTNTPFFRHLGGVSSLAASDMATLLADPPHTRPTAFQGFAVEWLVKDAQAIETFGPTPRDFAAVLVDPAQFVELRQRWLTQGLSICIGRIQETEKWEIVGFRFDREQWTLEQAQRWLREHKFPDDIQQVRKESQVETTKIAAMLGMPETAAEAEVEQKLAQAIEKSKAAPPIIGAEVATLLGVAPEADLAAVTEAVEGLKVRKDSKAAQPLAIVAVATALGLPAESDAPAILARIGELGGRIEGSDAETLISKAVADRKIPPANKGWWVEQAKGDLEGVKGIIASMPPIIGAATSGLAPAGDNLPELSPEEEKLTKLCGNDPAAVRKMKAARAKGA